MRLPSVQRVLLTLAPAFLLVAVAASTLWGPNGLATRHALRRELAAEQAALAATERENQRLLRELRAMERDPVVLERLVAEELSWGRSDATLYRFVPSDERR